MNGLASLSRAMFLGFVRDRAALFFTIIFPLMFLVLFGGIFRDQSTARVKVLEVGNVAVLDQVRAADRTELDKALSVTETSDLEGALRKVRDGDYVAAIEQRGNQLTVHYSEADAVKAATVQGFLSSVVQEANLAALSQPPRYAIQADRVEDKSLKTIQFVTPGLLGWAIASSATFGSALTLVTWREKKILRRLRLAPIRTSTVVGARVVVSVVIALAVTAIFIEVASLPYFGLKLSAYWWMSVPLVVSATLAFLGVGVLIGSRAKTPEAATGVANFVVLPMAFLSGAFFPLDNAPRWLRIVSDVLPLKHFVEGMKDVMVRGQGPASVLPAMAILLAFAAVLTAVATRTFRWEDA
jgi:ABC-2 type transport system permease protein